jgi:hypothetical protein
MDVAMGYRNTYVQIPRGLIFDLSHWYWVWCGALSPSLPFWGLGLCGCGCMLYERTAVLISY